MSFARFGIGVQTLLALAAMAMAQPGNPLLAKPAVDVRSDPSPTGAVQLHVGCNGPQPAKKDRAAPLHDEKGAVAKDAAGDPLPKDALVRLGTLRYRHWPYVDWVQLSHDSNVLAFGSALSGFKFVDRLTGKELIRIAPLNPPAVGSVPAWSSKANLLVVACFWTIPFPMENKAAVVLWDTATGKELRRVEVPAHCTFGSALSPDAKTVAVGGNDGVVRLIDVAAGKVQKEITPGLDVILALTYSPNGQWLAMCGRKGVILWDVKQHRGKASLIKTDLMGYEKLVFSPDSQTLVGAGGFTGLTCWKVATGEHLGDFPNPGGYTILSLSISADSKFLAVNRRWNRKQIVYDIATRKEAKQLDMGIGALSFSADGKFLASAEGTGVIRVRDQTTFKELNEISGHRGPTSVIRFLDNDRVLTVCPFDGSYRLWDARTGREKAQHSLGPNAAQGVLLSPDGTLLAVSPAQDGTPESKIIRVIEVATGKIRATFEAGFSHVPLAFAGRNSLLYAACEGDQAGHGNLIVVWDLAKGKEQRRMKLGKIIWQLGGLLTAALTPEEDALALNLQKRSSAQPGVLSITDYAVLIDVKSGKELWSHKTDRGQGAWLFASDGKLLLEAQGGIVVVRERANGDIVRELASRRPNGFPWPYASPHVMFPDGKTLLTTDTGNRVHFWDFAAGKEVRSMSTPDSRVIALAVSPDGRRFATAGDDMTVLIWQRP